MVVKSQYYDNSRDDIRTIKKIMASFRLCSLS